MSMHVDALRRMLDPEVFNEYVERSKGILSMREEVASEFRDLNPAGMEHVAPDGWGLQPWFVNWIRERGGLDLQTWFKLEYEEYVEWAYRVQHAITTCRKAVKEKLPAEELIKTEWLCHLSQPPAYMVRADIGFSTQQLLFGKYSTVMWCHIDWWSGEFDWLQGFHNEDGVPVQYWAIAAKEEIAQHFDEEDKERLLTPSETTAAPEDITANLDRRHLRTGIRIRDMLKKSMYDIREWLRPIRDIVKDLREEMFPKWTHATLYLATAPGNYALASQNVFWSGPQWWTLIWQVLNATRIPGLPVCFYTYEPLPPILNTLMALPMEVFNRRLTELFISGPKGLLCDAINKKITSERKAPLLHDLRRLSFEGRGMYKGLAEPFDDGIPPPTASLTSVFAPFYVEANIRDLIANPDKLSKEFWDLLESEGGIDKETGRIPPYSEVPRMKSLFDPTIEWLKPKDFPPFDWATGQVWPFDMTREKMEIMVEEGYDGSGKDILHYSALADKKMGREGKTILLGTMPYKLPKE